MRASTENYGKVCAPPGMLCLVYLASLLCHLCYALAIAQPPLGFRQAKRGSGLLLVLRPSCCQVCPGALQQAQESAGADVNSLGVVLAAGLRALPHAVQVKLVLQRNKFFVESPYPDILKKLLKVPACYTYSLAVAPMVEFEAGGFGGGCSSQATLSCQGWQGAPMCWSKQVSRAVTCRDVLHPLSCGQGIRYACGLEAA